MSVRGDITVNWNTSPRIITVASPSTSLNLQDLVDTLRTLEAEQVDLSYDHILDASGKQNLGGGVYVGITVQLYNAQVAFEARTGPSFIQCSVAGGNLVAVDTSNNTISPIYPTAYTQVTLTSSSSATLQESADIEYSSFNGGVTVDVTGSYNGTTFPVGTPRQPVNNLADALSIATSRGFSLFYIRGNVTLDSNSNYSYSEFKGESIFKSTLTVNANANVEGCKFTSASIGGSFDGSAIIEQCHIGNVNLLSGHMEDCVLTGPIYLSGGSAPHFLHCFGSPDNAPVIIDCGGSGQTVSFRQFSGELQIQNKTGPEELDIDLVSGYIVLDATVTNGDIDIGGVGFLEDHSTGNAVVKTEYLVNPAAIWNVTVSGNTDTGTMGEALNNAAGASAPPNQGGM